MTIQKPDFSLSDQTLIQGWIDTEIPGRIASLQESILQITSNRVPLLQGIEDVMEQIYASWETLHVDGFLAEVKGMTGETFLTPITETVIQSTASNPLGSPLYPELYTLTVPLQENDLRADPGDFDDTEAAWTGVEGSGSFAVTGYAEELALSRELAEWNVVFPATPSGAVLRDMWLAEEAALTTQLTALNLLDANLDVGQGGKANLSAAIGVATAALATVQGHLSNYPALPASGTRTAEITARFGEITARVDQIRSPGTDQNFVRGERYFWLTNRVHLVFGTLVQLYQATNSIALFQERINMLQGELDRYPDMGF